MLRKLAVFGVVALAALAIVVGVVAYAFLKPPAQASGPIQPVAIAPGTATTGATGTAVAAGGATAVSATATAVGTATTVVSAAAGAATAVPGTVAAATVAAPATATAPTTAATTVPGTAAAAGPMVFTIDQASSQARFIIDEVLNGADKRVVGTTDQVAGQIAVSPTAPATARVGTIQINARTLKTDSESRNRAIQNRVLLTDRHEYITFVPTTVTGLPASATVGQPYTFQIVGQLTVAGNAREATFAVTVTPTADGRLQGQAMTTIRYANWNLTIPSVPSVASVQDTLTLELDFVARAG